MSSPQRGGKRRADPRAARPRLEHDAHTGHGGHGHGHSHGPAPDLAVPPQARLALLGTLALVAVAVLVGIVGLWPDRGTVKELSHSLQFAGPGVTFPHATVEKVQPVCADAGQQSATCGNLVVRVDGHAARTVDVPVPAEVTRSGLGRGDRIQLTATPASSGATYAFYSVDRGGSLWLLAGLFALVVVAVARLRGLFALVGLAFGALVIGGWLIPGLLSGHSPPLVALVAAAAIMYVVLYLTHGPSLRTSAALAGTLGGLAVTALLGWWTVSMTHLSGVSDEGGSLLTSTVGHLDFRGLMTCTVIIAGLGVLNDVTITQAGAVWELRAAAPTLTRWRLWAGAMRIGRDHIASTIYTIVFAYAGTALTTLLVIALYDRPVLELLGTEQIAEEIVRSLVSAIGLVLAVPLTTAVATLTVPGPRLAGRPSEG
jgi:uncharacterized membrane protein